jgi:hypothetical protein
LRLSFFEVDDESAPKIRVRPRRKKENNEVCWTRFAFTFAIFYPIGLAPPTSSSSLLIMPLRWKERRRKERSDFSIHIDIRQRMPSTYTSTVREKNEEDRQKKRPRCEQLEEKQEMLADAED